MKTARRRGERTCLGCREVCRQENLLRYVLSPDNEILVDYAGKLPGRGAYTCLDPRCMRLAIDKKQFCRAFKITAVTADHSRLLKSLNEQIQGRMLNLLGMARKSSNAISGSNAVLNALGGKEAIFLVLTATDISKDIGLKISKKAAALAVPCWSLFDKATLGVRLGRSERSVIAVRNESLADSIKAEIGRLELIAREV